jgi:hypothetical protein
MDGKRAAEQLNRRHPGMIAASQQFVRYWSNSGQSWILARDGLSANDPTATLRVRCGNSFDAGFSPYRSARLSR